MEPIGAFGTPEAVAEVVAFLASPASRNITGAAINLMWAATGRHIPDQETSQ